MAGYCNYCGQPNTMKPCGCYRSRLEAEEAVLRRKDQEEWDYQQFKRHMERYQKERNDKEQHE